MVDLELQRRIREKKTPLALTLAPEAEKLNGKCVKNFIDMFGDTPMAVSYTHLDVYKRQFQNGYN